MYSSVCGRILLQPAMMVSPKDDRMVQHEQGVFDTVIIVDDLMGKFLISCTL